MPETSLSLLERLVTQRDATAWQHLVNVYRPWLHSWLRRQGVAHEDAEDLVQEVLAVVIRELPQFHHNERRGAFRCWLRTITANRLRGYWRAAQNRPKSPGGTDFATFLEQLEAPDSRPSRAWDEEHNQYIVKRLLQLIEPEFTSATWQAFRRLAVEGLPSDAVAGELGVSVNAVLIAKCRVMRRLRQELTGLVD